MQGLKSIYLRNLLEDFKAKRKIIAVLILAFAVAFAAIGMKKAKEVKILTDEQQEELKEYQEKIEEYDTSIQEAEEGLELAEEQARELQEYIDHSIYMKIDPQNIQTASVQYGVRTEANAGNILNALNLYINEGGLKEALGDEYKDLSVEGWREIVTPTIAANLLNITIIHYDGEQLQKILDLVKQRIQEQVPEIAKVQGAFTLEEIDSSVYVKSDVNVTNAQNNHRNNLKGYKNSKVDFENKLISQKNNKKNYIEKNEPEALEAEGVNPTVQAVKFAVVGILFGIMLPVLIFILQYILGNRIRSKEDLRSVNLNVIGSFSGNNVYTPSLERSLMDLALLARQQELSSVFLNGLCEDEVTKQAVSDYAEAVKKEGFQAETGFHVYEDADELKAMAASKGCVLFVQTGKTTYPELEQQMRLCERFQVVILGCVVIG